MKGTLLHSLIKVIRPHQWIKNIVCLAGLIFSGKLMDDAAQYAAMLAFAAFSAAASSIYLFNDYCDRKRDRENPRTANRPLASGKLPVPVAIVAWLVLMTCAIGLAVALNRNCVIVIVIYIITNILYSIRLKYTVIVDVLCIAFGFVLRVLIGVYAVGVLPSSWIVLCMFVLALFLGFSKRRGELIQMGAGAGASRPVLRKYTLPYLDSALLVSSSLSIMTYAMYTTTSGHNVNLVITVIPVIYCIFRYHYKVLVESFGESPEKLLFKDPLLWLGTLSWVFLVVLLVYFKPDLVLFAPSVPH